MAPQGPLPFATVTVAQIYLQQNKLDEAEAIYRQILDSAPDDQRCKDGIAEVDRRRQAQEIAPTTADNVEVEAQGRKLRCHWKVTDDGRRRARLVSGEDGSLALRLATFPEQTDQQQAIDTKLRHPVGSVRLTVPEEALLAAAAVGLLTKAGQFIAIAHSKLVPLNQQ